MPSIHGLREVSYLSPLSAARCALDAIAVLPLIQALVNREKWDQKWYADDSACAAMLPRLCEWFESLIEMGPDFGYYPNPQKSS